MKRAILFVIMTALLSPILRAQVKLDYQKPSKEILGQMNGFRWPEKIRRKINSLNAAIENYKFKDASLALDTLLTHIETGQPPK